MTYNKENEQVDLIIPSSPKSPTKDKVVDIFDRYILIVQILYLKNEHLKSHLFYPYIPCTYDFVSL